MMWLFGLILLIAVNAIALLFAVLKAISDAKKLNSIFKTLNVLIDYINSHSSDQPSFCGKYINFKELRDKLN